MMIQIWAACKVRSNFADKNDEMFFGGIKHFLVIHYKRLKKREKKKWLTKMMH